MAVYGDLDHVRKMLRTDEDADLGTDVDDRLDAIQGAVSLLLEEKCSRSWGSPVADTSIVHWVYPHAQLVLRKPARSITSVQYGGTMSGNVMTGGTTITAADLITTITGDHDLIYAIGSVDGWMWSWSAPLGESTLVDLVPIVVTGDFSDSDDDANVPADVTYAANILIVEQFRRETASPAGFTGPDGSTVPVRNPWNDPIVKAVVDKYSIRSKVPAF